MRHGCLLIGLTLVGAAPAGEPTPIRARSFDIAYEVNEAALPLESVHLWYTTDNGAAWADYGVDDDRQSPFFFQSPVEGSVGFFFVLTNSSGASSAPPPSGTKPQQCVVIDFTPPVVQLHALRQADQLGQPTVQIRWTAIDAQLPARPIELTYRRPPDPTWLPISTDPLANTGRYDWRVPAEIAGHIEMRATVSDLGGHRVESEPQSIELDLGSTTAKPSLVEKPAAMDAAAVSGSKKAKDQAAKLFADALGHRERGEFSQGVARLREAIKLDPQRFDAFPLMAGMLARLGDNDRALSAFDVALKQRPSDRASLLGAALVYRDKKDYPSAVDHLRTLLRYYPTDAEGWMNLGDVAVFQGDEVLARECYTRAANIDPQASQVIADAKQRLALLVPRSSALPRNGK